MPLYNASRDAVLAENVKMCQNFWTRLVGLLGTKHLPPQDACWIKPCNSIHTVGMKYAIDAYFLNKKNEVVSIVKNLKPNRFSPLAWKAHSVVEFVSGVDRNCQVGDKLTLQ
jgi:uncharacterized protein